MFNAWHEYGGAAVLVKLKTGATVTAGQLTIQDTTNNIGEMIPASTTSAIGYGVSLDTGTHTTVQGETEGVITCDARGDAIVRAKISDGATAIDMQILTNTSQDTTGLTITSADVSANDMSSGTIWRLTPGGETGEYRVITTDTAATSIVVTVPFGSIEVGDQFLYAPWSHTGDGGGAVQATTNIQEADGDIASGTGIPAALARILMLTETDSFVDFKNIEHAMNADNLS